MAAGQLAQARESFANAYKLNNEHLPTLRALAILEVRAKNGERADQLLEEATGNLRQRPRSRRTYRGRASGAEKHDRGAGQL